MIRPGIVWALAQAEMRLTRRLVRYWIFVTLATLATGVTFGWYAFIHSQYSWVSASAAAINPRYLVTSFGSSFMLLFLIGLIFLGYDLRARDQRERMVDVLDTLPCTNLELVFGRFLGILIPSWLPAFVVLVIIETVGLAIGWPIEPYSMVSLLLVMCIPAFTFILGLVYLTSILLRHRLLVAVVGLGMVVGAFVASNFIPLYLLPPLDFTGGLAQGFPSDLVPRVSTWPGLLQRLAFFMAGIGMVWLAAALHPRRDDASRPLQVAIGGGMLLVAAIIVTGGVLQYKGSIDQRATWLAAHERVRDQGAPDLGSISGEVVVRPGSSLEMNLTLRFRAPAGAALEEALFTLNPALEVGTVTDDSGAALTFDHHDGLLVLKLPAPLSGDRELAVTMAISGRPDGDFAYFDNATEVMELKPPDANILILGRESLIFEKRYVALLPGLHWLPSSGPQVGPTGSTSRPEDFYTVDLTVDLPEDWLAAGPGRREALGTSGGRSRFRFAPAAPLPEVALIAGPFVSRKGEVEGIELEVLLHPDHTANFDVFAPAATEVKDWLAEKFVEAADVGLAYPYDALTLVEVPNILRGFGGGWRMDTTLAQPTMVLMRESSFPTARYKGRFDNPDNFSQYEGGVTEGMRVSLENFFENDLNGGNPFIGAARSFFTYQTAAKGPSALPLDFVAESLATKVLADKRYYFSVHFFDRNFGQQFGVAAQQANSPDGYSNDYAEVLLHLITSRAEVWDAIIDKSLADLDPWEDPKRTIDVLSLKGGAMASSMTDALGREQVGRFLAALRERAAGRNFTRDDVLAAGDAVGVDLTAWLDIWINGTSLPGFTLGEARIVRIEDAADGAPRYQSVVTLRNDEQAPGMVLVEYRTGEGDAVERGASDPVQVPGMTSVEVGLTTSKPPKQLRVKPYLALNREPFNIPLPGLDDERIVKAEPFNGSRVIAWEPPPPEGIVVDDLDPGFSVEEAARSSLRVAGKEAEGPTDQGLPIFERGGAPSRWSRNNRSSAWGKYRRTVAVIKGGKGERMAVFTAALPQSGRYELEFHLAESRRSQRGVWNMNLVDGSGTQAIPFDADKGDSGWNSLGTFEIAGGEVRLEVTDRVEGKGEVMADAIRWKPVSAPAVARTGP